MRRSGAEGVCGRAVVVWTLAVVLCAALPAHGQGTVEFLSGSTRAEVGRTSVIAYRVSGEGGAAFEVEPEGVFEIVRAPAPVAGSGVGYVRVMGRAEGVATLRCAGAAIQIRVVPARASAGDAGAAPEIESPAAGAALWGVCAVSVRVPDVTGLGASEVRVELSSGGEIGVIGVSGRGEAPFARGVMELDCDALSPGTVELTPVRRWDDGREARGRAVRVLVLHPEESLIVRAEAEEIKSTPARYREYWRRHAGRDEGCSGGTFFDASSYGPAGSLTLHVEESGAYQVMVRASGSLAAAAYPTMGLVVNEEEQLRTNGRVVDTAWRRTALGVPVVLEPGEHAVYVTFENDFYLPGVADRNLRLDTLEVVRLPVEEGGGVAGAGMGGSMMMGGMSGAMMGDAGVMDPMGLSQGAVRIAFERPLEGLPLGGEFELRGVCWWLGADGSVPPPVTTLLLNGDAVSSQRSAWPRFLIDAAQLRAGENVVQLVAKLDSGASASTPEQRMAYAPPPGTPSDREPRRYARFSIHDSRWDDRTREILTGSEHGGERRSAALSSDGALALSLPPTLEGRFEVAIELKGDHFRGAPVAIVRIDDAGAEREIGRVDAPTWWDTRSAGEATLGAGPKRVIIAFENDEYAEGEGDRNLYVQGVVLREARDGVDEIAPLASVRYPANGQLVHGGDLIVADVSDDLALKWAELLVDGQASGVVTGLERDVGQVVLPVPLRGLASGEHRLSVRVWDGRDNSAVSEDRVVVVSEAPPLELTRFERAVTLLDRFGFGPDHASLAAMLVEGERAYLERSLSEGPDEAGDAAAMGLALAHFPGVGSEYEVPRRALSHAIGTPNPVRARFVLWTENHFSTWIRKPEPDRKWREHTAFTERGAAPFLDLLLTSATSPAMMLYLDQTRSVAGSLNENYAREIMELHTLGVDGGYTQADVTALAHVLTGWLATQEGDGCSGGYIRDARFGFDPALNDGAPARVVGLDLPRAPRGERYDRVRWTIEALAAHPSTARYVCRKLAEHYVSVPAPEGLVEDLAGVFHGTSGDMRGVLLALAEHPEFWRATRESRRLAHPLDFGVRLCRVTRNHNPWLLGDYLERSGAGLFGRPTPDGYPAEDSAYTDSNALVQRWSFAEAAPWAVANLVSWQLRWHEGGLTEDRAQRIVDVLALRLTGRLLGEASNDAAVAALLEAQGETHERVTEVGPIVAQMPEANMR